MIDDTLPEPGAPRDVAPGDGVDDPSAPAAPSAAPAAPSTAPAAPAAPAGSPLPPTAPRRRTVQYKGADLDSERGPGLGCFWIQVVLLAVFVPLTPISVSLDWPFEASAFLLFATIGLLLLTGQTIIFLLRLVAADRRGRRRPLASSTQTVGELEDARRSASPEEAGPEVGSEARPEAGPEVGLEAGSEAGDDVRQ